MLSERILEEIALEKGVEVSQEELQEEIRALDMDVDHLRFFPDVTCGIEALSQEGTTPMRDVIRTLAMRNLRIRHLLDNTIREQAITVTEEELSAEVDAIAQRQQVSRGTVLAVAGRDYGILRQDVLRKKAREWLEQRYRHPEDTSDTGKPGIFRALMKRVVALITRCRTK